MAAEKRFFVEYAKRDCNCKGCGKSIDKGDFRMMFVAKGYYARTNQHFHAECMFATFTPNKKIKIESEDDVGGWDDVKANDAKVVKQLIKKQSGKKSEAKGKKKQEKQEAASSKTAGKGKKRTTTTSDEDEQDDDEEDTGSPKNKKSKTAGKTKGSSAKTTAAAAPAAAVAPAAAASASPQKKSEDDVKREFRRLEAAARTGEKITANDFYQFSVPDLKMVLKLNDRSTTGNKGDLCKNVADYIKNGCPPRCPECGGGRLRVKPDGSFYCPGYMEDDEFQNCGFKAGKGDVARIPWKNPY